MDELLNRLKPIDICLIGKGDCLSAFACTCGPSDTVYIVLIILGDVIIDDKLKVIYLKAACGDISGDKNSTMSPIRYAVLYPLSLRRIATSTAASFVFVKIIVL